MKTPLFTGGGEVCVAMADIRSMSTVV